MSLTDETRRLAAEIAVARLIEDMGARFEVETTVEGETIVLERHTHESEGDGTRRRIVQDAFAGTSVTARAVADMRLHLRERRALDERSLALKRAGCDPDDPPPWAFLVHPAALALVESDGRDPADLGRLHADRRVAGGIQTRICSDDAPMMSWEGVARGMRASLVVRHGLERPVYGDAGGRPYLTTGSTLPETTLHAIVGRTVGEIASEGPLSGLATRVVAVVENGAGTQFLELERVAVPLAPAPVGADIAWMNHLDGWRIDRLRKDEAA